MLLNRYIGINSNLSRRLLKSEAIIYIFSYKKHQTYTEPRFLANLIKISLILKPL